MAKTAFQKWKVILTPVLVSPLFPGLGGSNLLLQVTGRARDDSSPRGSPCGTSEQEEGSGRRICLRAWIARSTQQVSGHSVLGVLFYLVSANLSLSLLLVFSNIAYTHISDNTMTRGRSVQRHCLFICSVMSL